MGLACAGIVTSDTGLLGRAPNLPGWENSDLASAVRAAFGPVIVAAANDVNAALFGESRYGAGRGCKHLVMLALGTGVGGGVMGGRPAGAGLRRRRRRDRPHDPAARRRPRAPAATRAASRPTAAAWAWVRRAHELAQLADATDAWRSMANTHGDQLTTRHCFELAAARDATALRFFAEVGRRLGQAAASLVNILAPERVIIGGGVAQAGDLVLQPCRDLVAQHVLSSEGRNTPVVPAELGPHAASMGAAALAMALGEVR